jgi:hypothetical protein
VVRGRPAGVLIVGRSAFLQVTRYACGMFLGRNTIPPSDSSISSSPTKTSAVPSISLNAPPAMRTPPRASECHVLVALLVNCGVHCYHIRTAHRGEPYGAK